MESPFQEHKVDFDQFITNNGGRLLDRVSDLDGRHSGAVLGDLADIFPLEMYFPIKGQLEAWQGDANLLVATQASDTSDPVIYNLRGERVTGFGARQATTIPTLVLVRREGRFKPAGLPIAFAQVDCELFPESCEGGGGGGGGTAPRGEWITSFETDDNFEGLFMGEPEFEITIVPRYDGIDDLTRYRCLGESFPSYSPRYWDVDDGVDWSGNAPILNSAEEDENDYNMYVHCIISENDDEGCQDEYPSVDDPDPFGNDDDPVASLFANWNGLHRTITMPAPTGHLLAFAAFRRYTFDPEP